MKAIVASGRSITWEGETYLPGEAPDIPKAETERLIQKGALVVPEKPEPKPEKKSAKKEPEPKPEKAEAAEKGGKGDAKE